MSDYINCLHPQKIYNKYLQQSMFVPCRKCVNCLDIKSDILKMRVENECMNHPFTIFFTLTYDDKHLPLYEFKNLNDGIAEYESKFEIDKGVYDVLYVPLRDVNLPFSQGSKFIHCSKGLYPRYFASSCKRDIQLFFKRLRKTLTKKFNKNGKIRYFVVSEYGSINGRPHYHGFIWTDFEEVNNYLTSGITYVYTDKRGRQHYDYKANPIYQNWKMCDSMRIELHNVDGGASEYVASYCTCISHLPKIFQTKYTRPFVVCSKNPIVGFRQDDEKAVFYCLYNRTLDAGCFYQNERFVNDRIPIEIVFSLFGKCYGFGSYKFSDLLVLCHKYLSKSYDKTLDAISFDREHYLHSAAYRYTDDLFFRHLSKYIGKHFVILNVKTGKYDDVVYKSVEELLFALYQLFMLSCSVKIREQLETQTIDIDDYFSRRPNSVADFPLVCTEGKFISLFAGTFLIPAELIYEHFYRFNKLDFDAVNYVLTYKVISREYRIKKKNVTKVFNEKIDKIIL